MNDVLQIVPDAGPASASRTVATADPRVLVVDDDRGFREMLRDFLADDGFDIVGEAPDGAAAVDLAEQLDPDVVLMDVRMPRMDGLEAGRRIKSVLPIIQIVMLSAYEDPALRRRAEELGAYCYLIKGCPPSILVEALRLAGRIKASLERAPNHPSLRRFAPPAAGPSTS